MPVGVVIRVRPGVTRWAAQSCRPVGLLPGAGPANWREIARDGDVVDYHAGTVELELHRADTEGYRTSLAMVPPSLFVVCRDNAGDAAPAGIGLHLLTASAYEAQDYMDSGEDIVEKVEMPAGLIAWIEDFVDRNHKDEDFVKRKRDRTRTDLVEDGVGDERIAQTADVYRAPASKRRRLS